MSALLFPMPTLGYVDSREPVEDVSIYESAGRKEFRETWSLAPRYRYKIKVESLRSDAGSRLDFQALFNFYARHRGPLDSFLFQDPEDQAVTDHGFAVGNGVATSFQLQRTVGGAIQDAAGFSYPTQSKPYLNMVKNSSFETDTNADGTADSWGVYNSSSTIEPATATIIPGANGGKAQRVSWGTNNTTTKGLFQSGVASPAWISGQWYTIGFLARASGTNLGKFMGTGWNTAPTSTALIADAALSTSWQRYIFQVFWTAGSTITAEMYLTIANAAGVIQNGIPATFGDLDFDEVLVLAGQYDATTLPQPNATPAAATATDTPAYWPALGDGFEPIYDLKDPPTIYQDGDWFGRRQLYPFTRSNLLPFSEQLDNAAWGKTNVTVTANQVTAPDGAVTGDQLSEGTTATVQHFIQQSPTIVEAQGELHCYSVFVRPNNLPNIVWGRDVGSYIKFNLGTGVIDGLGGTQGNPLASGVVLDPLWFSRGWYRIWFVNRAPATPVPSNAFLFPCLDATYNLGTYTGTNRSFYAWGAQCERTSNLLGPTPYIKTPSSTAVTVTDYSVDSLGNVTPATVLPSGAFLSWDGTYYRRARFEDQNLTAQRICLSLWGSGLSLLSVKP